MRADVFEIDAARSSDSSLPPLAIKCLQILLSACSPALPFLWRTFFMKFSLALLLRAHPAFWAAFHTSADITFSLKSNSLLGHLRSSSRPAGYKILKAPYGRAASYLLSFSFCPCCSCGSHSHRCFCCFLRLLIHTCCSAQRNRRCFLNHCSTKRCCRHPMRASSSSLDLGLFRNACFSFLAASFPFTAARLSASF